MLLKPRKSSSVPALRCGNDEWAFSPDQKAEVLANVFSERFNLPPPAQNEYSEIDTTLAAGTLEGFAIRPRLVHKILSNIDEHTATGSDLISARLLKKLSPYLCYPLTLLARIILDRGIWPDIWRIHWICPLHKRLSRADAQNYRGVHMSTQLSKVIERVFSDALQKHCKRFDCFGPHQYAYTVGRGHRDALAIAALSWISAWEQRKTIGLLCSDVSGAFDRVSTNRLCLKLRACGVSGRFLHLLASWLERRIAHVILEGTSSCALTIFDAVFQGTCLGPILWNIYFSDSRCAVKKLHFTELTFADDLNSFRFFDITEDHDTIWTALHNCQAELHKWGEANQVIFEPSKETLHILQRRHVEYSEFKLLGIVFDNHLLMHEATRKLANEAGWRLNSL